MPGTGQNKGETSFSPVRNSTADLATPPPRSRGHYTGGGGGGGDDRSYPALQQGLGAARQTPQLKRRIRPLVPEVKEIVPVNYSVIFLLIKNHLRKKKKKKFRLNI